MGIFVLFSALSIVTDIVWVGVYAGDVIDNDLGGEHAGTAKFSLALDIISLLMKPVTLYLAYKFFTEKGGTVPTGIDGAYNDAGVTYQTQGYQNSGYDNVAGGAPAGDATTI